MFDPDRSLTWSATIGSIGLLCLFLIGPAVVPVVGTVTAAGLMHKTVLRPAVLPSLLYFRLRPTDGDRTSIVATVDRNTSGPMLGDELVRKLASEVGPAHRSAVHWNMNRLLDSKWNARRNPDGS